MKTSTLRSLIAIALPMVISQGAFAVMIFTDRFFMSMISPMHMSASLGGGVAFHFCLSLFLGMLSYANALVAQYYGRKQFDKCSRVLTQGMLLSVLSLPLLVIITIFTGGMFAAMGHDPEQAALEKTYYYVLMWGSFFVLIKTCLGCFFSGIGQTQKVMIADIVGVALNVPLSYAMIFGKAGFPEMGIVGAGVGTIISNVISLAIFIAFYSHHSVRIRFNLTQSFRFDGGIIKRYVRLGLPSGVEMFLNVAAFNLFLLMFQSYGIVEGASAAIVFNWDILSFVPMMGINIGIVSLIGRYIGAGNMEQTNEVIASGFLLALGYSALLATVFVVFRQPLVELFITEGVEYEDIRELASFMMLGLASYVMADATILVVGGVLRGAGDTRWLMVTSVVMHWLMLLAQYVVIKVLKYGPKASWMIFTAMILSIAAVYLIRLFSQRWRDPEVLRQVMAEH